MIIYVLKFTISYQNEFMRNGRMQEVMVIKLFLAMIQNYL